MYATKMNFVSRAMALSLIAGVLLAGCSSNDPDSTADPVETQSAEITDAGTGTTDNGTTNTMTTDFAGTWRNECREHRLIDVDEEDQPGGYVQSTLTLDSTNNTYSERILLYTDSQCTLEDPDKPILSGSSGEFIFDGVTTTSSGMEATIVRYNTGGTNPEMIGLLYRDGDVLYRDLSDLTLILDIVPKALDLSNPWRLVN